MVDPHPPLWSPRFRVEGDELQYKPHPSYPTWLVAWTITGGSGETFDHFPASPLRDNFDRPDETPVNGFSGHITVAAGSDDLAVKLDKLTSQNNPASASGYSNESYSGDQTEVYCRAKSGIASLFLNLNNPETDAVNTYMLTFAVGSDSIYVSYLDGPLVWVDIMTPIQVIAEDDWLGLRKRGDTVSVWYRPANSSVWGVLEEIEHIGVESGRIGAGIFSGGEIDDFGGGEANWSEYDVLLANRLIFAESTASFAHFLANLYNASLNSLIEGLQAQIDSINTQIVNLTARVEALENP